MAWIVRAILMSLATAAVCAQPAFAGAPDAEFSGPYLGVQVGYGFGGNTSWCDCSVVPAVTEVTGGDGGMVAGVLAGWDVRAGALSLGVAAQASFSDLEFGNECSSGVRCDGTLRWSAEARAHAGVVWDDYLIYAMGGYATGEVASNVSGSFGDAHATDLHEGAVMGGGVEMAMSEGWRFGLEYDYYDMSGQGAARTDVAWRAHLVTLRIVNEF